MHDYTKRVLLRHNLRSVGSGYMYYDLDSILKKLQNDGVRRDIPILDTGYELLIYPKRLTDHSDTITLNVEVYNANYDEVPTKELAQLFDSNSELKGFLTTVIEKFVDELNNSNVKVKYFEEFNGSYSVINGKMYAAIYDFATDSFYDVPEPKEATILFEQPDVDKLIEQILKD